MSTRSQRSPLDVLALIQAFETFQVFAYAGWASYFVHDHNTMMAKYPFYRSLNGILDHTYWLLLFAGMSLLTAVGVGTCSNTFRRGVLAVGVAVWTAVWWILLWQPVPTPYTIQALGCAIACFWASYRIGPHMEDRRWRILNERRQGLRQC